MGGQTWHHSSGSYLGVGLARNPGSIRVGLSLHERPQLCVLPSQLQVHLISRALFFLISFSFP